MTARFMRLFSFFFFYVFTLVLYLLCTILFSKIQKLIALAYLLFSLILLVFFLEVVRDHLSPHFLYFCATFIYVQLMEQKEYYQACNEALMEFFVSI